MIEIICASVAYIIAFIVYTVKIDKRVSLLEETVKGLIANQEKVNELQMKVLRQEMSLEQLNRAIEEIKNDYRELSSRLDKR